METEYKWELEASDGLRKAHAVIDRAAAHACGTEDLSMHAVYYDTADGLVSSKGGCLRIRQENDRSVCCLKLSESGEGACTSRREYEVEADDIAQGLERLPHTGAPKDLCAQLLAQELEVLCETKFHRRALALNVGNASLAFDAELAVDVGMFARGGHEQEFAEIELEYKGGEIGEFHAYAAALQDELDLKPQPLSKLARAMSL